MSCLHLGIRDMHIQVIVIILVKWNDFSSMNHR